MSNMGLTRLTTLSLIYFLTQELSNKVVGGQSTRQDQRTFVLQHTNLVPTRPIFVYVDGELIEPDSYNIYPQDGRIVFSSPLESTSVTADYHYSFIDVVDAYRKDILNAPIVAIENVSDSERGMEIGTNTKLVTAEFRIHIYAATEGQRDDITDSIKRALDKTMPIWDFNKGFPVLYGGEINPSFDANEVVGRMLFEHPSVIRNPLRSSDRFEVGRAIITVKGEYVDFR